MSNLIRVFVLLFGVLIYSQDTLSVKDGAYGYDQEFKLDVNLKTESDIKALQFDLNFDENNFTYASTYSLYKDRLGTDSDHTITVKKVSDSKIRVLIYSPSNKPFDKGDGKLVDFDFKNSINYGDYSFSVTNVVASLVDNSSANLILVNGTIRTKAPGFWKQYSQVNFGSIYKGSTDSRTLDLQNTGNSDLTITLVKNELSKFTLKDSSGNDVEWPIVLTSKEDSDNGIGNWSYQLVFGFEADANGTYEEVISFTTDEPKNDTVHEIKVTATVYNENKLVVKSNSDVYNDQESKINVEINGDEPITSFQFDITPTNSLIGLVDSSAKLLNTTTDHVISSKVLSNSEGENYLRVISYSPSNSVFTQPIGDIVEFKILPSGLNPGDYGLLISNAVLTNGGLVDVTSSTENGTIYIKAPKFDFSPAQEYNLGEVLRNTNDSHNFTIQNQGSLKLTISSITSTDPNLFISTSVPIEIETGSEQIINFDLLPTSDDSDYSSKIIVEHNAAKKSDTLKVLANIESRNTVKLIDAVYANAITKNIPLELLNSDKVKGLQFDLTFPEESKSISYTLTADGSSNYVFAEKDNAKDPDLVVYVGDKINFINNAGSTHPLFIVTNNESGYDKSNELSSGVTNQGADSGTLILDLSNLLPGTYYYICGNHKSMTGKITVLPKFSLTVDNTDLVSDRATGFNVSQSLLEARKYRVLLYSDTNSTFTGNIGNIMNIPITVSDITDSTMQISDGTYPILIDNIVISGSDNTNITSIPQTSSKAVFTTVNLFSPVVESNQSVSINENPTADVFFYTVIASDSDDNSFVNDFKIASGNDSGTFGISSNTGELYVKVPSDIDYESVQSYALGVTASDGTKTSAIEIVTVSVIDDPNVFVTEDLTVAIYRDNTDSGIITDNYNNLNNHKTSGRSSNSDDTQKVIYSVDDGVDKEFFSINSSSGELSFISAPSFANPLDSNKDNVYEVTLKAQNIDDTSEDLPVVSSRKSISILENNSAVTSVTTFISQAQSDLDGDGIIDTEDICPTIANPGQEDSDGNGEGDACQDTDGDGVLDKDDICPIIVNPGQEDSDGNGIGDVCEDTDGDGVSDTDDNCPLVANPGQEDLNNNNIGDVCEFGPVAVANTLTVNEDATLISTNVISNDTEQDGDTLSLTAVSTDGTGTVAVNSDGLSVDYTPAANFNGTETITYTVSDGALSANGTFTITVTAVNDAPVAVANTLTVDEDSSISNTDVIANDTDVEDDTLTLTAVSTDGTGTVAVNSDGLSVDYTPAANFNGTETITYTVSDGALSANGTFTITVTAVNDAPVAVANTLTVDEDSSISNTDVIANDTDVEDDTLTLTAVSTDGTGTVAVNSDGLSVDYTPAADFNGTETITYTVSDGALSANGTFTITVTAVNDAPVAVANTLTVDEDSSISNTDVIANDTDVEDDTLTLTAVSTDGTGTVAVNSDGLSVDYTPAANFNGTETITYTVSDGALSANGTFTITVTAVNDAPVAVANTLTVDEDSSISNTDVIANDTDVEDDTLTLTAVSTDGTGTVAVNSDGLSVDYTPAANFNGTETITYTVSDGTDTSEGTFTITVTAVNDAPVAVANTLTVDEDSSISNTDVIANDTDVEDDTLTLTAVSTDGTGTVAVNSDGLSVDYTPAANFNGTETITYTVSDGTDTSEGTFTITVTAVNDAPVAIEDSLEVIEDSTLTSTDVIANDTDIDGDTLSLTAVSTDGTGTVAVNSDGLSVDYTPAANFNGTETITYTVSDGTDTSEGTFTVTVTSNDLDEDGVLNVDDTCPDTPADTTVDVNGCPVFTLPLDNNKVWVTSASCIGNTDGSIGLSIEDDSYNYTVTVTGQDDPITLGGETKTASVTGLGTGAYTVCFKVDGQDAYEQCFEVNIAEPKALSAFIDVDNDNRTTSIQLSGSSSYNVEVNGQRFDVKGDRFTTSLPSGLSIIKISTDLDCQGIIEREIFISEDILYYPNPTLGDVNVYVNGEDSKVTMSVFSSKGDLIFTREQEIQSTRKTDLDLGGVPAGTYLVTLDGPTVRKTFKIVKR